MLRKVVKVAINEKSDVNQSLSCLTPARGNKMVLCRVSSRGCRWPESSLTNTANGLCNGTPENSQVSRDTLPFILRLLLHEKSHVRATKASSSNREFLPRIHMCRVSLADWLSETFYPPKPQISLSRRLRATEYIHRKSTLIILIKDYDRVEYLHKLQYPGCFISYSRHLTNTITIKG